ncbi:XRE family transcriptional regulator [Sphingomonas sp. TF3]|nr:XRE family transcriptional regulator [Sphingomonas sp. TF3]
MPSDHHLPRSAVPASIGPRIRLIRKSRRWSQTKLASKLGVDRRTIIRLESGQHVPTSHLIHAIEELFDLLKLVPAWPESPRASAPCYGPRVRAARRAANVTATAAAVSAGVSPATFSRFERGAMIHAIVGDFDAPDEGIRSDALAILLGFIDAAALNAFCMASEQAARQIIRMLQVPVAAPR